MATNEERTFRARTVLIAAAREQFGLKGYDDTTTPQIAASAGMTRGALYHHFRDKRGLFEAVVEEELIAVSVAIGGGASPTSDPIEALVEGGDAFINALSDPASRRILLIDAPRVLGQDAVLALDNSSTTAALRAGIEDAISAGRLPSMDAAALTSLMSGAYDRAVLETTDRQAAKEAIRLIWHGLTRTA